MREDVVTSLSKGREKVVQFQEEKRQKTREDANVGSSQAPQLPPALTQTSGQHYGIREVRFSGPM